MQRSEWQNCTRQRGCKRHKDESKSECSQRTVARPPTLCPVVMRDEHEGLQHKHRTGKEEEAR